METLIRTLAVSRITRLVTKDYVAAPLRRVMKESGNHHLSYLSGCAACCSVYAAILVIFLPRRVTMLLAMSEATTLIRLVEDHLAEGGETTNVFTAWGAES